MGCQESKPEKAESEASADGTVKTRSLQSGQVFSPNSFKLIKKIDKLYVQKRIDKEKVDHARDSVLLEKHIMANISSPFLPRLCSSRQDERFLYLYLNFEIGGDLLMFMQKNGAMKEASARFYIAEILLALGTLHANKIVHCDVKPENVLITSSGNIKLIDFGVSFESELAPNPSFSELRQSRPKKRENALKGTYQYSSPEMVTDTAYNYTTDFWSLGIILFMLIKGYHPFATQNDAQTQRNIMSGSIMRYPSPEPSNSASNLISQLLEVDPTYRLGSGGVEQIKGHQFFSGFDWEKCMNLKMDPPYVPNKDDPLEENFDKEMVKTVSSYDLKLLSSPGGKAQYMYPNFNDDFEQPNSVPIEKKSIFMPTEEPQREPSKKYERDSSRVKA